MKLLHSCFIVMIILNNCVYTSFQEDSGQPSAKVQSFFNRFHKQDTSLLRHIRSLHASNPKVFDTVVQQQTLGLDVYPDEQVLRRTQYFFVVCVALAENRFENS